MVKCFGLLQCKLRFFFLPLWDCLDCLCSCEKTHCLFDSSFFPTCMAR